MTATDRTNLRDKVRIAYSAAAEMPQEKHAFPVGRAFAESLGYPADLLDQLPAVASDAFAGVSNVSIFAEIPSGATILDLGCRTGRSNRSTQGGSVRQSNRCRLQHGDAGQGASSSSRGRRK